MIKKIVSGGQTGVDQAALETALKLGLPYGGWCPKGRLAENGTIPPKYSLTETESNDYSVRTKLNIRDSDGTLILTPRNIEDITDGTLLTIQEVKEKKKPFLIINLSKNPDPEIELIVQWSRKNNIKVLNIAGPRESQSPGINQLSLQFLEKALAALLSLNNDRSIHCDESNTTDFSDPNDSPRNCLKT